MTEQECKWCQSELIEVDYGDRLNYVYCKCCLRVQ